ncbi:hypothetical protein F0250_23455 [Vibrio cyclitrophicus]|uniref:YozE family protein n=1 Tax=Vibrio cyclitrophicus TaxID=47951 RepID=UPI00148DED5F|nr:YozE family protein [Vibrio cyclitrophicus]NOI36812.1 hypothetical protein [Vibrio cyclitrophicus]
MKTFYGWLIDRNDENSVISDLADDVIRDEYAPTELNSYKFWLEHLQKNGAIDEAKSALKSAWFEYLESRKAKGFKGWLTLQINRSDLVGDLARDVANDKETPKGRSSFQKWHDYLLSKSACDGAMEALNIAWDNYKYDLNPSVEPEYAYS